ncbi:MAG TPA: glycosyltransferase family 2 protein [Mycobacteriales bacterium]|nr:glycosyltransferase family 2 protein [Mycobacteriales bacterium]
MPQRRVLVVVPAFNEQECLPGVLAELAAALPQADVLVVDDASTDRTRQAALGAGVRVLSLPINLGVGGAMRAGYRYALRFGYDVVLQVDGDGQHDPRDAPALLAALDDGADVVIGARFAGTGEYDVRGPRRWAMRLLASSLSRRTGTRLTDTTSGFRACSRRAVALFARHYPAEYLGDTVEALVLASRSGLRVAQVPVTMRPRAGGRPSQSPLRAGAYLGRAALALVLARVRRYESVEDAA